jgi:hypothetical protein
MKRPQKLETFGVFSHKGVSLWGNSILALLHYLKDKTTLIASIAFSMLANVLSIDNVGINI